MLRKSDAHPNASMKMSRTPTGFPALLALLGCVASTAVGQEDPESSKDKGPPLRVNLVAVGDFPVSGFAIKDERPMLIEPEPTELIPATIFVKDGKDYRPLSLVMNSPSEAWA